MTFHKKNLHVFGKRFLAYIIDSFLCSFVSIVVMTIASLATGENEPSGWLVYVIFAVYYVFMFGKYGQTIGYKVLKIKIQMEDGSAVDYKFAFYRLIATSLSTIIFFLGFIMILFNEKAQALHDKLAKLVVIEYS